MCLFLWWFDSYNTCYHNEFRMSTEPSRLRQPRLFIIGKYCLRHCTTCPIYTKPRHLHIDSTNLTHFWFFFQGEKLDLTFLQHIREVTGYVLISHVDVTRIILPSLQIIRGQTLFKLNVHDDEFALIVTLSKMHNLELPALRGKTVFFLLCICRYWFCVKVLFVQTIYSSSMCTTMSLHSLLHFQKWTI